MKGQKFAVFLVMAAALIEISALSPVCAVSKPTTIQIRATHIWDDGHNRRGKRSDQVIFYLRWSAGDQIGALEHKTISGATDRESQTVQWDDLPAYCDGQPISYYLSTEPIDGYHTELAGNAREGFTITDHYTGERHRRKTIAGTCDLTVEANWQKESDHPEELRVILLADDRETDQTALLSDKNGWRYTFHQLVLTRKGRTVEYTVMEDVPEGYVALIRGDEKVGYSITNRKVSSASSKQKQ